MSALAEIRVAPSRHTPERYPTKPPQLRALEGGKNKRTATLTSPLRAKTSFGFFMMCAAILVSSLVVVLILNTNVINGSFESARLQKQIRQVEQDIQTKQEMLSRAEANLPNRAIELGLTPAANPEVINITPYVASISGEVIGGVAAQESR
jgi:hypothetical protein